MTLPQVPLPRDVVPVGDGDKVEIRGLSRAEVVRLQTFKDDQERVEVFLLTQAAGVSEDEAKTWRESVDVDTAGAVLDRICELSGITDEGASKSNGSGVAEGGDRPAGVPGGGDAGHVAG